MANKTVEQLQEEFNAAEDATRAAYDAWATESKYNKTGTGVAAQNKGSVKDLYERAVTEKDSKRIAEFKAEYDRLAKAYKKEQEKKNALRKELAAAKKTEEEAKKKEITGKSAGNVYTNTLKDLAVAEAAFNTYKGEEKYIAAYKKAQAAYQTAINAGKAVAALPEPRVTIPVETTGQGGTGGGEEVPDKKLNEYIDFLADPKNSSILKTVQQNLAQNFKYTGNVDGKWSLGFQKALGTVASDRSTLPKILQGGTLLDYIAAPTVSTGVSGTSGTSGGAGTGKWGTISNKTAAKALINDTVQKILGRDATAKEITNFTAKLQKAQKDNPFKQDASGMTIGGLDAGQFIQDLVQGLPEYATKKEASLDLTKNDIRDTARLNGLALSDKEVDAFTNRIKNGEDIKTVNQEIRNRAALGQPESVKKLLASGSDLDSILYPYKSVMSKSLDINPDTIDINDPTLRQAFTPEGEMSLYDFSKAVRQDNRWKYSQEANDEVTNMVNQVKRDFGFMG